MKTAVRLTHEYYLGSDCPICRGQNGRKCTYSPEVGLSYCRTLVDRVNGWVKLSVNSIGFGVYKRTDWESSELPEVSQYEEEYEYLDPAVHSFRTKQLIKRAGLSRKHLKQLKARGLTEVELNRVLPFVCSVDKYTQSVFPVAGTDEHSQWESMEGLLVVAQNVEGYLQPAQIRTELTKLKYPWVKDHYVTKYNQFDELPLQVVSHSLDPIGVILCEGILKPAIAAAKNPHWCFIGGSGGHFGEKTLKHTLDKLGRKELLLACDAGSMSNPNVKTVYTKLMTLVNKLGFSLYLMDWGQLYDKSKPDIDQIYINEL